MAVMRCGECHATIPVPTDLSAISMRCAYCGLEQPVPDLEARRRALVEAHREARVLEDRRAEAAHREGEAAQRERKDAADARDQADDRKATKNHRLRSGLISLVAMLVAPTIIAVTVFDLPARLGYGASGSDRLEVVQTQLLANGCTVLDKIDSEYATSNVSRLLPVDHQCVRIFAAGGNGHGSLALRIFGADGKELAKAGDTTDPQLELCATSKETLRYEIDVGPAAKGRLSHLVLGCPAKPADPVPAKPKR